MTNSSRGSTEGDKEPYMRVSNWMKPEYHFWERPSSMLSENAKQRYRDWVNELILNERNLAVLDPNLK